MARSVANPRGVAAGQHSFSQIPSAEIQRSVFDRSNGLTTAFNSAYLYPIFCDEALPGDTMAMRMNSLVRMATPLFPVMDNIWMDIFFFFVPNRLLWSNWERFNGAQDNPGDNTDFQVPQFVDEAVVEDSLSDYIGIPPKPGTNFSFNSLHHRAYNLIYNSWFRDQNLQDSVVVDTDDGPDDLADYVLLKRGKRHDYFTSCLPFPQKGDPVLLPLGSTAPVVPGGALGGTIPFFEVGGISSRSLGSQVASGAPLGIWSGALGAADPTAQWEDPALHVDLTSATSATINDIRLAFQVQRLLERDARGGSRYTEILRAHFGVISDDSRLQRPEYLGGNSARVNMHPVPRTTNSATHGPSALAYLGAFAEAQADCGFLKSFTEHGVIIGLVNVRADLKYQQGIERMFSRRRRFDYYWPALAHIGEQAVLNQEIYAQGDFDGYVSDLGTFGFQERYAEYRYKPSHTTGRMRSSHSTPIDQWHLAQEFGSLPVLNDVFIVENPPFPRVQAVTSEPEFFGDFWFDFRCTRPMPMFGVPGFVDHF